MLLTNATTYFMIRVNKKGYYPIYCSYNVQTNSILNEGQMRYVRINLHKNNAITIFFTLSKKLETFIFIIIARTRFHLTNFVSPYACATH